MSAAVPVRVRCRRVDGPPVVAVRVGLPGGSRAESLPGTALVTGRALVEGSRRRGWRRIHREAEERGIEIDGLAGREGIGLAIDCLADELDRALDWAVELALEPAFVEERVRWVARQAGAELSGLADQPPVRAGWAFLEQLYHPNPRCRPLHGDLDSLARIAPDDCLRLHRDAVGRGVIVTVTGRLDEDETRRRVEESFAASAAETAPPAPPDPTGTGERRRTIELAGVDQAHLFAGHLTVARHHPDLAALEVLGVVLGAGAGLGGRIPERVRERDGLAYIASAEAAAGAGAEPGRLEIYLSTSRERVEQGERAVREEVARLAAEGPSVEEFETARDYLVASEPFRFETARQWAELLLESELQGLPLADPAWRRARWQRLEHADLVAAAARHLRPAELRLTLGLPA